MRRGVLALLALLLASAAQSVPMYQSVSFDHVPGVFEVWYDRPPGALGPMVVTDSQLTLNLPGADSWTWTGVHVSYHEDHRPEVAEVSRVWFEEATSIPARYTLRTPHPPYYPTEGLAGWDLFDLEIENPYSPLGGYWGSLYATAGAPQVIPEPSPFALVGLSLGVVGMVQRKRQ